LSTQGDKLKAIADAIRAKEGSSDPIIANDFPARIAAIETGVQLPTLTNPGTAADMAQGKQLIGQDGEIIEGNLLERTSGETFRFKADSVTSSSSNLGSYWINWTQKNDEIIRSGALCQSPIISLSTFGNATAADVASGKTFTSEAGVMVTGTAASMPAMATVTVNIGSTNWTNTDIFAPFDYLSIGSPFDSSATKVLSPAAFQVPVGGAFGIASGAGGVKPISITGGRIIIDSEGTDGNHYSMIVVESASCYITMGLT